MTTKPRRPCSVPYCPNLTDHGRCSDHRRDAERARGSAAARGYDGQWQTTRARYLADLRRHDPDRTARCENCGRPETDDDPLHVDHIDGLGPHGPRGHDPANLQALCHPCHSAKTQAQTRLRGGPE